MALTGEQVRTAIRLALEDTLDAAKARGSFSSIPGKDGNPTVTYLIENAIADPASGMMVYFAVAVVVSEDPVQPARATQRLTSGGEFHIE